MAGRDRKNAIARVLDPPDPPKKPKPKIVLNEAFLIENRAGEYQVIATAGKAEKLAIAKVNEPAPETVSTQPPKKPVGDTPTAASERTSAGQG